MLRYLLKMKRLLSKPIKSKISLEQLLADITSDNLHGEVDTGHAVGKEFY